MASPIRAQSPVMWRVRRVCFTRLEGLIKIYHHMSVFRMIDLRSSSQLIDSPNSFPFPTVLTQQPTRHNAVKDNTRFFPHRDKVGVDFILTLSEVA